MHILFPLSLSPSGSTVASGEQTTWKKLSSLPHSLPLPDLLAACSSPLSLPLDPSLVRARASLSFYHALLLPFRRSLAILQDVLAFHACVRSHNTWIIDEHPWSRIPEISCCCYSHPHYKTIALSKGDVMIRSFNKCFYLKWTVICGVFLVWTSRGFCWLLGFKKQQITLQPAELLPSHRIVSAQP